MMITDASLNREQICAASFNRWLWLRKESFGCLSKWFSTQIIVSLRWSCWNKTGAVRQHHGKVLYLVDDSLVAWVSCGPAGEAAIRDLHVGRCILITDDSSCCKGKGLSYFQDKWQHVPVWLIKPIFNTTTLLTVCLHLLSHTEAPLLTLCPQWKLLQLS